MWRDFIRSLVERIVILIRRRFLLLFLIPFCLLLGGAIGYQIMEGLSFFDSLYLTVITLTTVGYGDIHPTTLAGRIFTMIMVLIGVFTFFYAASEVIRVVVSGEFRTIIGRRHMERTLAHLQDHIIVCGFGRMGKLVCGEFSHHKIPFVIIDANEEELKAFSLPYGIPLVGDANSDEELRHAGIERARGMVTVMPSDADNLFTTMSARLLNPKLFIVTRVEDAHSEQKLKRAGANRIVSPYLIGGMRMAQAIIRPTVVDFIELATKTQHIELQLEETKIAKYSSLANVNLVDCGVRNDLKVIVVAIKKSTGNMLFNPSPETKIEAGDILVAIGHRENLQRLQTLANPALDETS